MTENEKHPILVVDDEEEILYSLRGLLRREFEVYTAQTGEEAIRIMETHAVHVVMTDQRMPEMTGVQLLSRVQGKWPDAIRMVFTGYSDIKAVIDAINEGHIFRYITKPWDPDELRMVLHQACEEYVRLVAYKELLVELRAYHLQVLELARGLRGGGLGNLSPAGRAKADRVEAVGIVLLDRLEQAVTATRSE
jgi:DNA-binding NtrC family response regulator